MIAEIDFFISTGIIFKANVIKELQIRIKKRMKNATAEELFVKLIRGAKAYSQSYADLPAGRQGFDL